MLRNLILVLILIHGLILVMLLLASVFFQIQLVLIILPTLCGFVLCIVILNLMNRPVVEQTVLPRGDAEHCDEEESDMQHKKDGEHRINSLSNQINPHFLYNAFESLRGKAYADGNPEIAEMTEAISAFFRYISAKSNVVSLKDELDCVARYFQIQQLRFEDRFMLQELVDVEERSLACCIPKLTLQPLIENAIMHGLERSTQSGLIRVHITESETLLHISIRDNGVGIPQQKLDAINENLHNGRLGRSQIDRNGGIALENINNRVKMFFGDSYGLRIYSVEGVGTDVRLELPKTEQDGTGQARFIGKQPVKEGLDAERTAEG